MKKQLIKEILEINKLLKNEIKLKEKSNSELQNLNKEINIIEEKIKNSKLSNKKLDKIENIEILNKLYSKIIKKNKEKTFIENNLFEYKKHNQQKEIDLETNFRKLIENSKKNEEIISKKKEELFEKYEKFRSNFPNKEEQEQIIIGPEIMSIHFKSKITMEIEFMNRIKNMIKLTKIKNGKILKEIDSNIKTLTSLNSKKDSSYNAELSTGNKNSSHLENKNIVLQKLEILNNANLNGNNDNDLSSSISMELETNLNLDELPSDDESLRFIDKVFDIKSDIKPIKNKLKSVLFPLNSSISKEKTKKVEPIKIERPIDYKSKEEDIIEKIEEIKKEIENKKNNIIEIKNEKNNIEEKNIKNKNNLNQVLIKIKIIREQINLIKKQMEDFSLNKNNGKYFRVFSINNIFNNQNYCVYNKNANNIIYNTETITK